MSEDLLPIEELEKRDYIPKCNAYEKEIRINETVEMLCGFHSYGEICKFLQDKYGIARKTAEGYLQEAREIVISTIPQGQEIVGKHVRFYERVIKKNEDQDVRSALIASANLEKLMKLHNPEIQVNQQFNTINLEGVDIHDVIEAIKMLKEKKEEK
jgi:hypothetical protein